MRIVIFFLALFSAQVSYAQEILKDVQVEGNNRVLTSNILLQISSEKGGEYDPSLV